MVETAPHARCNWRSSGADAAGTPLMVLAILLAARLAVDRREPESGAQREP